MLLFFSMKMGYGGILGSSKSMWGLWEWFFNVIINRKVTNKKAAPGLSVSHY